MLVSLYNWVTSGCLSSVYNDPETPVVSVSPQEHSPIKGSAKKRTIVRIQELDNTRKEAKELEWKLSLEAVVTAAKTLYPTLAEFEKSCFGSYKAPSDYLFVRVVRMLDGLKTRDLLQLDDITETATALVKTLTTTGLDVASVLRPYFANASETLFAKYCEELESELRCYSHFRSATSDLETSALELAKLIYGSTAEHDPKYRLKAILFSLRRALKKPAYGLMRCDEKHPIVRLLHRVALGSFAHSETLPAYLKLGKAFADRADIKRIDSLGDMLISTRETAANAGFPEDDPLVNDWQISKLAERHLPEKTAVSISKTIDIASLAFNFISASIPPYQILQTVVEYAKAYFCTASKDYRGIYDNLPGALYEETYIAQEEKRLTLRVVVTASPAQGSTIQPEFLAVLQALENRGADHEENEPYPYSFLCYTNLQNRFKEQEAYQSQAIMDLNERYPFSFEAVTLATDPFTRSDVFDETACQKMINILQSDNSNYAFPLRNRDAWFAACRDIVVEAFQFVRDRREILESKKLTVFTDLVNLSLIRFRETQFLSSLTVGGHLSKMLAARACAVSVDRGMMVNGELLYIVGRKAKATAQIEIGRGVLAKKRLPLEERVRQLGIFAHDKHLSEDLHTFLSHLEERATEGFLCQSVGVNYPGCTEEDLPLDPLPPVRRKLFND